MWIQMQGAFIRYTEGCKRIFLAIQFYSYSHCWFHFFVLCGHFYLSEIMEGQRSDLLREGRKGSEKQLASRNFFLNIFFFLLFSKVVPRDVLALLFYSINSLIIV